MDQYRQSNVDQYHFYAFLYHLLVCAQHRPVTRGAQRIPEMYHSRICRKENYRTDCECSPARVFGSPNGRVPWRSTARQTERARAPWGRKSRGRSSPAAGPDGPARRRLCFLTVILTFSYFLANFERLVFGCIEAEFCK